MMLGDKHTPKDTKFEIKPPAAIPPERKITWEKALLFLLGVFFPLWLPCLVILGVKIFDICLINDAFVAVAAPLMVILPICTLARFCGFRGMLLGVLILAVPLAVGAFAFGWGALIACYGP